MFSPGTKHGAASERPRDDHVITPQLRKILIEGKNQRAVAREMAISRNTVRRYLAEPLARKRERGRPALERDVNLSSSCR